MQCIVCDTPLADVGGDAVNQPIGGTEFTAVGHYGSGVFDPGDGSMLVINVCDECLKAAQAEHKVLFRPRTGPVDEIDHFWGEQEEERRRR